MLKNVSSGQSQSSVLQSQLLCGNKLSLCDNLECKCFFVNCFVFNDCLV